MSTRALIVAVVSSLLLTAWDGDQASHSPGVRANHEWLVGARGERHQQVAAFKGIPFASAPVGALRWRAPQPHRPRHGPQRAQAFAPACYQDSYNTDWYRKVGAAFGVAPGEFVDPPVSEDCLYLNVWTPRLDARAGLPVMVWLYGGSNRAGWSFEPNYRGENLAAGASVVVVTVAYRVGIFGFFGHPALRDSPAPANFSLLDQIAALRWVQQNIGAFGGDPRNVTVFGESAGAGDIGHLVNSPAARGLFQRAISQSGGFQMRYAADLQDAEQIGLALAAALPGTPDLEAMRRLPSKQVFEAARSVLPTGSLQPVVDGRVVLRPPAEAYRREGLPFDLLIGSNQDEWYMYLDGDPAKLQRTLDDLPPAVRDAFARRAAEEADVQTGHDRISTLAEMTCPAYLMAATAAGSGHRAWVYRFDRVRPGPGGRKLRVYHGAEIPYVFDTHDQWLPGDDNETRLTAAMMAYWAGFARTGDPNGAGLVRWPAYDPSRPQVLELGATVQAMDAPDAKLCEQVAGELYPGWAIPPHQ